MKSWEGKFVRRCAAFAAIMAGCLTSLLAEPFNGCPDFMDLSASYVDKYTGMMDHPFDSLGMVDKRHHLNEKQGKDSLTGYQLKYIPDGEVKSVRLGNHEIGGESEALVYHYIVDPDNSLLFVNFAVVLEDPGHDFIFQPRFVIRITDKDGKLVNDCSEYDVTASAGLEGFQDYMSPTGMVRWRDWTKVGLDLSPFIGQEVQVQFITYDCFLLGHFGYAYFTAECAPNRLELDVCGGGTFTLAAPAGFPTYRWDNGDTSRVSTRTFSGKDMNIYCEVTSVTGCKFTQSAYVTDTTKIVTDHLTDTICQGESYEKNHFSLPPQMEAGTFGYHNEVISPTACSASSEVDLSLTILQTFYPIEASICEGEDYDENGFHISRPPVGVLKDTLRFSRPGTCDSVVCLRLTVSETKNLANSIVGDLNPCTDEMTMYYIETEDNLSKYKWEYPENVKVVRGEYSSQIVLYFTDDKPVELTLVGENGCGTSAVPITVHPRMSYHIMLSDTVCEGENYVRGEINLGKQNKTGVFTSTYSYKTRYGCDSSIVLTLHVLSNPKAELEVYPDKKLFCDSSYVKLSVKTFGGDSVLRVCEKPQVKIGDIFCSDMTYMDVDSYLHSGKMAQGVVYSIDYERGFAYIVGLEEGEPGAWSFVLEDIPGIENQLYLRNLLADMDGFAKTSLMRSSGDSLRYPSAWNADLENGWYIPAIGELRRLLGSYSIVNASLKKVGGEELLFGGSNGEIASWETYASSSEFDETNVICIDYDFSILALSKKTYLHFRHVRTEKISSWIPPSVKLGDLIENPDGSKGVVCHLDGDGRRGTMVAMPTFDSIPMLNVEHSMSDTFPFKRMGTNLYNVLSDWSGYENTKKIREAGDSTIFPWAWRVDFDNGWYIPSVAQMNYLYANSIIIDSTLYRVVSDVLLYKDCWTSTYCYGKNACVFSMGYGVAKVYNMSHGWFVCPMRDFVYCEDHMEYLDSSSTYLWNNGDTTDSQVVFPQETSSYSVVVKNSTGSCSTKLERTLVVKSEEPIVLNRTICAGEKYQDEYFSESVAGRYDTIVNNGECDQTIVLNLSVLQRNDTALVQDTICLGLSYKENGFNMRPLSPGVYCDTVLLSDRNGCDSVVCLRLNVLPAPRDTQYARVCQNEAYAMDGFLIAALQPVGTKYWEVKDSTDGGCLRIHVLGLTVDTVYQVSMVDSICKDERYQRNGFDFVADDEEYSYHYRTLTSSSRCDSVIALRLKTFQPEPYIYYDTVLYYEPYRDANFDLPPLEIHGDHSFDTSYVDGHGCDSMVVLHLHVLAEDDVKIPSSFTPSDGNGINDVFMENYEIFVYDRYGLLVCHSDNGWDGTYRGAPADAGVYLYTIRFKSGKEKHGTVEILKE